MINPKFWHNKKVLITGCTGFKGSWLTLWLHLLGSRVYGYSLPAPTNPAMWDILQLDNIVTQISYNDIRDYTLLHDFIKDVQPDIIIHMAAQPLVRYSYNNPLETYAVNVMGTVNLFEACRVINRKVTIINITTDKCYENKEWIWAYRENEALGGHDPYSNSKSCSELITSSYTNSFFTSTSNIKLASARAGNVIGGGDFSCDRLIPDIIRQWTQQQTVKIRYPNAIRPWQHVLEPLSGYLVLAENLFNTGHQYAGGWNFGPQSHDIQTVAQIVTHLSQLWGNNVQWQVDSELHQHEAHYLRLDCSKAQMLLHWQPVWHLTSSLEHLYTWYKAYTLKQNMLNLTTQQIQNYMKDMQC